MILTTMTFIDDVYTHALLTDLFRTLRRKADALSERNALLVFDKKAFKCDVRSQHRSYVDSATHKDEIESISVMSA